MNEPVPFLDLVSQHAEVASEVDADVAGVFATASFVGGPHVAAFEQAYARFVGTRHCVGLANGTDAVELALRALGVGPGDEVVTAANTFVATVEAIARAGARPVLVDVDDDALLIDPDGIRAAVTSRTKAVVPVHLYGQVARMESVLEAAGGIPVVEDAAQSQGATRHSAISGSFGAIAATSFYPGKNLGAAGDAGAITTDDDDLARRVRLLANHGSLTKYVHETLGFNSRLDAIQAIVLRHKLARLSTWNAARRKAARRYDELLEGLPAVRRPVVLSGNEHVWHLYVVRVPERDRVLTSLLAEGVGAALHYPQPVHLTEAFRGLGYAPGSFPVSEKAAQELLSLPMFPHITAAQQVRVVEALTRAL